MVYVAHTCILTLLLSFVALILPRSTSLFAHLPLPQSSLDKPQYAFLVPITASPLWTLQWLCAGTAACLSWWAGWMRVWHRQDDVDLRKIEALLTAWTNTFATSLFFYVSLILFGAPLATHIPHTYLLALLLALLTALVPSYALSLPVVPTTLPSLSSTLFNRTLAYPALGTLLGAWVGAFPIALDWDRPWQAWPLTPAYGALAGYVAASWAAVTVNTTLFFASAAKEAQAHAEHSTHAKRKVARRAKAL